jgi:hypothetical protein
MMEDGGRREGGIEYIAEWMAKGMAKQQYFPAASSMQIQAYSTCR